jgi:AhpD family alkylhydroperoxidase
MPARMPNPIEVVPDALQAALGLAKAVSKVGLPQSTMDLVHLRTSQINGCAACLYLHSRDVGNDKESDERFLMVAAWREAQCFTDAERAALALAEAVTRLSDRPGAVSDEIWDDAAKHYSEQELGALVISIGMVNLWNRINVTTRQVPRMPW